MPIQTEIWSSGVMNLTDFSICIAPNCQIAFFVYFRDFSSQSRILSFSEYLNAMLSVLVGGSNRGEDKNKEILVTVDDDLCKLRNCYVTQIKCQLNFVLFISRVDY